MKIKIQKARVAVQGLPDVERTLEEQEVEIAELEEEVRRLRGVLGAIGREGRAGAEGLGARGNREIEGGGNGVKVL